MELIKEDWLNLSDNAAGKYDFPDPDVIRVDDVYYMVSTTMHFMPGCELLRSYDLLHWEHTAYVYDTLDSTPGQRLAEGQDIYGKGMWAASLRYRKGIFYICFVANDTHKTYLYTADDISGPWEKHTIEGVYHDCSLLFDETRDGERIYIVYGNKEIWITELRADLSGPKEGGLHRMIVEDKDHPGLGYEGSHIYKINKRYYVFLIHSRRDRWMRVEACFSSDSLEGTFTGGDIFEDTMGYCGQGIAQGGIVDTPDGKWYAMLFQDRGASGRMPVLLPMIWRDNMPVLGDNGKMPVHFEVCSTRPQAEYKPLVGSDDFTASSEDNMPAPRWQFNHEPWKDYCQVDREKGCYRIWTSKVCRNLTEAPNTITQRMRFPECEASVVVDAGELLDGDYAGICALQGCYSAAALTVREGRYDVVLLTKDGGETVSIPVETGSVRLRVKVDFWQMKDEAVFYYQKDGQWIQIGDAQKLYFKTDHFTGCRFGLFAYASRQAGGQAAFRQFRYVCKGDGK